MITMQIRIFHRVFQPFNTQVVASPLFHVTLVCREHMGYSVMNRGGIFVIILGILGFFDSNLGEILLHKGTQIVKKICRIIPPPLPFSRSCDPKHK